MSEFFSRNIFGTLVNNAIAAIMLAGPMLLAAAGVAALLLIVGAGPQWPWFVWVVAAPVIYLFWVIFYLAISASSTRRMGRRYPKPRRFAMRPGHGPSPESLGFRTAVMCHLRWAIVERLPFARATGRIPCLSTLWMRAYSPSLRLGNSVINFGFIVDPDLTEVGNNALIGGASVLVAHTAVAREDGTLVFTSAPIRIGHRVTLGGGATVSLGCVIEDDAVLEPCAVVAPFTRIPAGEVWGGHPASFLRKRIGFTRVGRHNRGAV
jgi:acetyltransferase-like isoleucine patch superfamily enzyme